MLRVYVPSLLAVVTADPLSAKVPPLAPGATCNCTEAMLAADGEVYPESLAPVRVNAGVRVLTMLSEVDP